MNLLAARVVLRPRPLGEVLDLTVPFCLANWRLLARVALSSLLPALALCLYVRLARAWTWPAVWLLAVGLGDLLEGLFAVAFGELLFQPAEAVRAAAIWGRFARRLPTYLMSWLVARILLALSLMFVPITPLVAVHLLFVREVVLLEGAPVFGSIGRSYRFVQRQVGSSLALLLALVTMPPAVAIACELLGDAVINTVLQLGRPVGDLWTQGGSGYALVGFFLSVPISAGARFLKYIDVRTRKEGWDLQLRFTAIAAAERDDVAGSPAA
jgi:hypothetical protein